MLDGNLITLQQDTDRLRNETIDRTTNRARLARSVGEAMARYNPTRSELDQLLEVERRLPEQAISDVASPRELPGAPVGSRAITNIALAGTLALVLGIIIAFTRESYRRASGTTVSNQRESPARAEAEAVSSSPA